MQNILMNSPWVYIKHMLNKYGYMYSFCFTKYVGINFYAYVRLTNQINSFNVIFHTGSWQYSVVDVEFTKHIPYTIGISCHYLPKYHSQRKKYNHPVGRDLVRIQRSTNAQFLPEASFGLRVLSLPASVCVCVRARASTLSLSAR